MGAPWGLAPPPQGNPGSATVREYAGAWILQNHFIFTQLRQQYVKFSEHMIAAFEKCFHC